MPYIARHVGDRGVRQRETNTGATYRMIKSLRVNTAQILKEGQTLINIVDPQLLEGSVGRNRGDESNSNEELLEHLDLQGHSMEGEQRSTVCQAMLCYISPHVEKHRTRRHRCRSGHALHELWL